MRKHFQYLRYLVRHKWFVLLAGLRTGAPLWRLIIHDWSKFLPDEWFAYVDNFYDPKKKNDRTMEAFSRFGVAEAAPWPFFVEDFFNIAWLKHQKRNKHHWQYWTWINDDGGGVCMATMPEKYIREMIADWAGAGRAITGKWDVFGWYDKNKHKMKMRDETIRLVEQVLAEFESRAFDPEGRLKVAC